MADVIPLQAEAVRLAEPTHLAGLLRAIADRIEAMTRADDGVRPRHRTPSEPVQDPYLDLKALASYSHMSRRWLEERLKDSVHPLPHYRPGGKVLVKRSEFDRWMAEYRRIGSPDVDRIVGEVLSSLGKI